jgi:hypothetical protein
LCGEKPLAYELLEKIWDDDDYRPGMKLIEQKLQCCGWLEHRDDCELPDVSVCEQIFADLMDKPVKILAGLLLGLVAIIVAAAVLQIIDMRSISSMKVANAGVIRDGNREDPFIVH